MVTADDRQFMQRALFVAERGRGTTSPNPVVGAVVVSSDGIVVGQGAHRVAGRAHAEVIALDAAGDAARGATLYCTLEPCCHTGRTGPCTDRIVAAGVSRVVAALQDPNPRVAGGGFGRLREHGVAVEAGVEHDAALRQNAAFVTWISRRRPHVTLKIATSTDGWAGRHDRSVKLSGAAMDRVMHRERAAVDAIAVGSTTILVDDPRLTARMAYRHRPLVRVVFDRRGRVRPSARLFQTFDAGPVIMVMTSAAASSATGAALRDAGATVWGLPDGADAATGLRTVLERLAALDVLSLLVEGGPTLHRAMWDAVLVDRVQIIEAPLSLDDGVPAFLPEAGGAVITRRSVGGDRLLEWDVHRTD